MAKNLNFEGQKLKDCADQIMKLYALFIKVSYNVIIFKCKITNH